MLYAGRIPDGSLVSYSLRSRRSLGIQVKAAANSGLAFTIEWSDRDLRLWMESLKSSSATP